MTQFQAFELFVFIDGGLNESQMFHGARVPEYPAALEARTQQFVDDGWTQERSASAQ